LIIGVLISCTQGTRKPPTAPPKKMVKNEELKTETHKAPPPAYGNRVVKNDKVEKDFVPN